MRWGINKQKLARYLIALIWAFSSKNRKTCSHIPVLCYHRFLPQFYGHDSSVLYVTPEQFESHMQLIGKRGLRSLTLREYLAVAAGELAPEERSVLVTIDDGYFDVYSVAWPIAKKHGVKINLFILTAEQDQAGPYLMVDETPIIRAHINSFPELWRPLRWNELRAMHNSGIGIGLHGYTHAALSELEPSKVQNVTDKAIKIFQSQLGFQPSVFALPYGNEKSYNNEVLQILNRLGFKVVFSTLSGRTALPSDKGPFSRLVVHQWDDLNSIQMRLFGAADLIGASKRVFARCINRIASD